MKHDARQYGACGVRLEFERRYDSEVAAPAAYRPEEILVLVRCGGDATTVGLHHFGRKQVIERETVFAHEPAQAAAQRQA